MGLSKIEKSLIEDRKRFREEAINKRVKEIKKDLSKIESKDINDYLIRLIVELELKVNSMSSSSLLRR